MRLTFVDIASGGSLLKHNTLMKLHLVTGTPSHSVHTGFLLLLEFPFSLLPLLQLNDPSLSGQFQSLLHWDFFQLRHFSYQFFVIHDAEIEGKIRQMGRLLSIRRDIHLHTWGLSVSEEKFHGLPPSACIKHRHRPTKA